MKHHPLPGQSSMIGVKGGFLRSMENHVAVIRSLGFDTSITYTPGASWEHPTPITVLVENIRGYEIVKPFRYDSFERHFSPSESWLSYKMFDQKIFNFLGVKYFLQEKGSKENKILDNKEDLKKVAKNGKINIYQNLAVMPRAFVVFNIHPIDDFFKAKDVFFMETFKADMTAIVETPNPVALEAKYQNNPDIPFKEAQIILYQSNKVIIETETDRDGFLVLSDVYDRGWQAFLDEEPQTIYPTNVAFRGLFVPQGKHQVIFQYKPKSYVWGKYLSIGALVFSLFLIILWLKKLTKTEQ